MNNDKTTRPGPKAQTLQDIIANAVCRSETPNLPESKKKIHRNAYTIEKKREVIKWHFGSKILRHNKRTKKDEWRRPKKQETWEHFFGELPKEKALPYRTIIRWLREDEGEKIMAVPSDRTHTHRIMTSKISKESENSTVAARPVSVITPSDQVLSSMPGEPPCWAWNLKGLWTGTKSHDSPDPQIPNTHDNTLMVIQASTDPDTGCRQYHGKLLVPKFIKAIISLAPLVESSTMPVPLEVFEQNSRLKPDCWPGPSPYGQDRWHMRCSGRRATYLGSKVIDEYGAPYCTAEADILIEKGKAGRLFLTGKVKRFSHGFEEVIWLRLAQRSTTCPPKDDGTSFKTLWQDFLPDGNSWPSLS